MRKFHIEWETDFCDNFPEKSGITEIEAETESEAIRKFHDMKIQKACIFSVDEIVKKRSIV